MKELNKQSTKIMWELIALMGDKHFVKIDNNGPDSGLMPLHIEIRQTNIINPGWKENPGRIISLAHYYQQNGDTMSDPYMEFLCIDASNQREPLKAKNPHFSDAALDKVQWKPVTPITFEQHGLFARHEQSGIIEGGQLTRYFKRLQAQHTTFANQWLMNLKYQQLDRAKKLQPANHGKQIELFYILDNKGVTGIYTNPSAANLCQVTHARTMAPQRGPGKILSKKVSEQDYKDEKITVSNIHSL